MWNWFDKVQYKVQSKFISGQTWYNLKDLCYCLKYQPNSYRLIFRRLPSNMKQKTNLECDGLKRIKRCCVNEEGLSHILFSLRDKRKKQPTDNIFLQEQLLKKMCTKL